jgi:hypothetical protein
LTQKENLPNLNIQASFCEATASFSKEDSIFDLNYNQPIFHNMAKHSFLRTALFFLMMSSMLVTCKKEIQLDNTDQNFPLQLALERVGGGVQLKWNQVAVSKFERYVLVRAENPMPSGGTPNSVGGTIVFETTEDDVLSFDDTPPLFAAKAYYKLFTGIDGRWMESQEVETNFDNLIIDGTPQLDYVYQDSNWVVIQTVVLNTGLAKLHVVDLNTMRLVSSLDLGVNLSADQVGISVYRNNGQAELALWYGTTFRIFSMPDLSLLYTKTNVGVGFSVAANDNGWFFCTQNSSINSYCVRKRTDFSIVKSETRSNYFERRTIAMLDPATSLMVEASPFTLRKFNVDPVTGVSTNLQNVNTNINSAALVTMSISADGQRFMPGEGNTAVYDRQLSLVFEVPVFSSQVLDANLSRDGNFVYSNEFDFFTGTRVLRQYSINENGAVTKERSVNDVNILKINETSLGLFVMATPFNNNNIFSIQSFKF